MTELNVRYALAVDLAIQQPDSIIQVSAESES